MPVWRLGKSGWDRTIQGLCVVRHPQSRTCWSRIGFGVAKEAGPSLCCINPPSAAHRIFSSSFIRMLHYWSLNNNVRRSICINRLRLLSATISPSVPSSIINHLSPGPMRRRPSCQELVLSFLAQGRSSSHQSEATSVIVRPRTHFLTTEKLRDFGGLHSNLCDQYGRPILSFFLLIPPKFQPSPELACMHQVGLRGGRISARMIG